MPRFDGSFGEGTAEPSKQPCDCPNTILGNALALVGYGLEGSQTTPLAEFIVRSQSFGLDLTGLGRA